MERLRCFLRALLIAFCARSRRQWSQRTLRFSLRHFPVQPVVLAFTTRESLCVLFHLAAVMRRPEILRLRVRHLIQHVNYRQFVLSDLPCQDFLLRLICAERPFPSAVFTSGNGNG